MSPEEFNALSEDRRSELFLQFTPFIDAHEGPHEVTLLYKYGRLYVEVTFSSEQVLQSILALTPADASARYNIPALQMQQA